MLTGLEGGPFLAGHTDILKVNVAVGQQEAQRLSQGLHVEVDHFVAGHGDTVCLEDKSKVQCLNYLVHEIRRGGVSQVVYWSGEGNR